MGTVEIPPSIKELTEAAKEIAELFDSEEDLFENEFFLVSILSKRGIPDSEKIRNLILEAIRNRGKEEKTESEET